VRIAFNLAWQAGMLKDSPLSSPACAELESRRMWALMAKVWMGALALWEREGERG